MSNRYSVNVPSYYGVSLARKTALRECVMHSSLRSEFSKGYVPNETLDHFSERMDNFIQKKGLHIIEEKPVLSIDGNQYDIDICFTVAW